MRACAITFALIIVLACTKRAEREANPFNNAHTGKPQDTLTKFDPNTIAGIYANILKPTCSNSGCHDGTFEPDFRTVESAWNTLLFRPPIKNDSAGSFQSRVVPGNADLSMLWYRLTVNLGGNSGIMPLVVDPGSDWHEKKAMYLENIRTWINQGAKDQFGNAAVLPDPPPQLLGMSAVSGGNVYTRPGRYEPVQVPLGSNVDLWFAFADDKLAQSAMANGTINFSLIPSEFNPALAAGLVRQASGNTYKSMYGQDEVHLFRHTFSTGSWSRGDVVWLEVTISDGVNGITHIPGPDALFYLKKYLAIRII